ncbi:MAG: undecaprenyldiphospho-muramoylpentapeptide beta-N-acetylglucosaminyltransferase [Chloroflexota bacterium]|nr:undecaprenyldiphospho-muramoylpentapeptide beta-N-acetylglucosaminyltransferase [Chloroflexota bacterium]
MRLLISGGGTGGHVYPALTVAAAVQKQAAAKRDRVELLYVGRAESVEERLAHRAQIPFQSIETGQVRGMAPWIAARSLWRVVRSIGRARGMIRDFKPDVIFVTGGYVSAPVIWASAVEKIPSVIYLPDLEPGWAIRATSRWATRVAVSFGEVAKHFPHGKAVVTGYPVRAELFQTDKAQAREELHLDPNVRTVAIFGGSTGAHHINQAVVANLVELVRLAQVIHLTGRTDEAWVNDQVARLPQDLSARIRVFGYLDEDLPHALGAADVVVARAGAATLGEFPALGVPAILVPGPYAGMHQERNASFLVKRGGAVKVDDGALSGDLMPILQKLFDSPERLKTMSDAMRALAQPNAAANIAALLETLSEARA